MAHLALPPGGIPPPPQDPVMTTVGDIVRISKNNTMLQGIVRFIGPIQYGQGIFYGVELDKAKLGETNGSFAGKSYFKTTKNRGIFITEHDILQTITDHNIELSKRVTVNDTVFVGDHQGSIQFIGPMSHSKGMWFGIQLSTPDGNNDGTMHNVWYFNCKKRHGIIVRSDDFRLTKDDHVTHIEDKTETHIYADHKVQLSDSFELEQKIKRISFSTSESRHNRESQILEQSPSDTRYNSCYFLLMVLSFCYCGFVVPLPTTMFYIVSEELELDEALLGSAWVPVSIMGIGVSIGSGFMLDKIHKYHYIMAAWLLTAAVAIAYVPISTSYYEILVSFILIDAATSVLAPSLFVGIFRVYNINGSWIISLMLFLFFLCMAIMPQIIAHSIRQYNDYAYALYFFSAFSVLMVVLYTFIPSPRREKLMEDLQKIVKEATEPQNYRSSNILPAIPELNDDILSAIAEEDAPDNDESASHVSYILSIRNRASVSMFVPPRVQNRLSVAFGAGQGYQSQRHFCVVREFSQIVELNESLQKHQDVFEDVVMEQSKFKQYNAKKEKDTNAEQQKKQKRIIRWFAVIAITNEFIKCSNRYSFVAFLTTLIEHLFGFGAQEGLDLITTYFAGQLIAQFITIFLMKVVKPATLSICCSFLMVISSSLLIITPYLEMNVKDSDETNQNSLYLLHWVSFCNGFGSSPLFSTSLAFLCDIQPLTGMLSSLYNSADAAAGLAVSAVGLLIKLYGVNVLIYMQSGSSILVFILFIINQRKYTQLLRNHELVLKGLNE